MSNLYEFKVLPVGELQANCIILKCLKSNKAAIIDAGADSERIVELAKSMNAIPIMLLNTHAHYDHLGAVQDLKNRFKIPFYIAENEKEYALEANKNMSSYLGEDLSIAPDKTFHDQDIIEIGDLKIKVLETPGHTKGGSCFLIDDLLIAGDTIFKQSVGRSDLYGGNSEQLIDSIKSKILVLPDNTIIIPGHGELTSVGYEKKYNGFLQ